MFEIDLNIGDTMESLFLFLKGILIGIGKIIPGVSGSLIAVILHVYEEAIMAINYFRKNPKRSFCFLFPIGLGVLLSAIFFSRVLLFFLDHWYYFTMFFFIGLILGTVPKFQKEVVFISLKHYVIFFLSFLLPFLFSLFSFQVENFSIFYIFLLGFIDAATMIIPGISGTAIFLMLGSYSTVLNIIGNPFGNIFLTIFFSLGMLFGILFISKLVEIFLKKNRNLFYLVIDGLLWSSIVYLISLVSCEISLGTLFPFFLLFSFGFFITYSFSK